MPRNDPIWSSPTVRTVLITVSTALLSAVAGVVWHDHEAMAETHTAVAVIITRLDQQHEDLAAIKAALQIAPPRVASLGTMPGSAHAEPYEIPR